MSETPPNTEFLNQPMDAPNVPNEEYPGFDKEKAQQLRDEYKNESIEENNPEELTPEEMEWYEGHTDDEVDELSNNWDAWGRVGLGYYHGKILTDMYYDKELGWKFTDFKSFFDNANEINLYSKGDEDSNTVSSKLSNSLDTLKQALGEDSPEYSAAVRKIFVDIHNGKYKDSQLVYDGSSKGEIIFGNQEEAIAENNQRREEAKRKRKEEIEKMEKEREENWKKNWRNPDNNETIMQNRETIDDRTFTYLNRLVANLDKITPEIGKLAMDAINQKLLEGSLNGSYLNNQGFFYTGELANEYRGYDQEDGNSNKNDSPVSPIKPNRKKPEVKTPDDFGFRDWKN